MVNSNPASRQNNDPATHHRDEDLDNSNVNPNPPRRMSEKVNPIDYKKKIIIVGDSVLNNIDTLKMETVMKSKVVRPGMLRKNYRIYGADYDPLPKFRYNNHTNTLPRVVQKSKPSGLVIQASITDITNIKLHLHDETQDQLYMRAENSSISTLQAAVSLLDNQPELDIMVFKRPPRLDEMSRLSEHANQVQFISVSESTECFSD